MILKIGNMFTVRYDNEKRFTKQRKKLNRSQVTKLTKCIEKLAHEGVNVKYADNHIINIENINYHTMDLSQAKRLVFRLIGSDIVLYDCDNHKLFGKSYLSTKSDVDY